LRFQGDIDAVRPVVQPETQAPPIIFWHFSWGASDGEMRI